MTGSAIAHFHGGPCDGLEVPVVSAPEWLHAPHVHPVVVVNEGPDPVNLIIPARYHRTTWVVDTAANVVHARYDHAPPDTP